MFHTGRIAYLDVTTEGVEMKTIPQELTQKFLGGRGINSYLLFNHTKPATDPLSPQNPLIIGPGLLTGLKGISFARCTISGKSPETGLLGDSNIGGHFGAAMKKAGVDHLVVTGASERPIYILINEGEITIEDAHDLWGQDAIRTGEILKEMHGSSVQSLCIGPAGENLVRFACIIHRKKNAAGRCGMGCLMGSKRIKAIAVKATTSLKPVHEEAFSQLMTDIHEKLGKEFLIEYLKEFGTAHLFDVINNNIGMGRTYNGLALTFQNNKDISPKNLKEKYYSGKSGCFSCPVACQHRYSITKGHFQGIKSEGPEYSVLGGFGPLVGINSLEAILKINDLINRYGLDASSTSNMIAWMIELFTSGIIDQEVTQGIRLSWGDEEMIMDLIHKIAHREGLGNLLALGAKEVVRQLGKETGNYVSWAKYLPQSDPVDLRYITAYALGNAVATRGSDHLRSRPTWEAFSFPEDKLREIYGGYVSSDPFSYKGKGRVIWWWESYLSLFDALGLCKLLAFHCLPGVFDFETLASMANLAIGLDLTARDVFEIGERITNIERMFLVREGITRKDDFLPQRYFEPIRWSNGLTEEEKDLKLMEEGFNEMLNEYYQLHGWDMNGIPLEETKVRLGLQNEPSFLL
ncbi:MAG TPA: aldehyde:ferredoxin oxidoreductase [Syntrophaceae bacterium]|nr:aldehyde:ferredoxin oxidoreductase [Syntrophaceae bacterium]